jgi:hypothetical protein
MIISTAIITTTTTTIITIFFFCEELIHKFWLRSMDQIQAVAMFVIHRSLHCQRNKTKNSLNFIMNYLFPTQAETLSKKRI